MKQNGYAKKTLEGYAKRLRHLDRNTILDNPNAVKGYIANMNVSNTYKEAIVNAYNHYVEYYGLTWKKPIYKRNERLPNVPSTELYEQAKILIQQMIEKLNQLISD